MNGGKSTKMYPVLLRNLGRLIVMFCIQHNTFSNSLCVFAFILNLECINWSQVSSFKDLFVHTAAGVSVVWRP